MSDSDRRQFLKGVLGTLVQAAGTVVLASTAASPAAAKPEGTATPPEDIQDRADRLASSGDSAAGKAANAFLNYRPVPTFGGFLNGGWPNGVGGLFRNAPWINGPWTNGPWRNGWPNFGWRNWWG
jgi:hypothetical protein